MTRDNDHLPLFVASIEMITKETDLFFNELGLQKFNFSVSIE